MTIVALHTRPYSATLSILNLRPVNIRGEEVVALQVQNQPTIDFRHNRPGHGTEKSQNIRLSNVMAERLQSFCRMHYVITTSNFDCRTFLLYMMGWKGGEITRNRAVHRFIGVPRSPNTSVTGKPYLVPSPSEDEEPPHLMLGILRAGYNLSVMGVNGPLVVTKNADLVKMYNSQEIAEITSATIVH